MWLAAVGVDQCTIYPRFWNGSVWENWFAWLSCFKNIASFNVPEPNAHYKRAAIVYLHRNSSALYTQHFNGVGWELPVQQGTRPWLAAAGVGFEDDSDPPHEHTIDYDDCRVHGPTPVYTVQFSDGSTQDYFAQAVNLAEIPYNEARSETIGAIDTVGVDGA